MKYFIVIPFLICFAFIACNQEQPGRETVLDGIVTIYDEIIYEVPEVPRWCERLGLEGKRIPIGDAELYVETDGEGIPMVLINGGPGGTHHYFHPYFSRAAEFAKVIYYDQRGCGLSDYEPGDGYTIQQAANDLENLRKALDLEQWVVVGYSYGGLLAQLYATQFPESLAGLVLVSSAISAHVELEPTRQYDFISEEEQDRMQEINQIPGLTREQRIFNRYLNGDWKQQTFYRPSKERITELARYEWIHDRGFREGIIGSMRPLDLEGAFHRFPVPTLIFEGKWDLTWNTDKPEVIHNNHPNAEMIVFEQAGHSPYADQPDEFFSELQKFVESLDEIPDDEITRWREYHAEWRAEVAQRDTSLDYLLRTSGWGAQSSERIAYAVSVDDIPERLALWNILRIGFAFYDIGDYRNVLDVFKKMELAVADISDNNDDSDLSTALLWQGHMLDLLDRRDEAVAVYNRVVEIDYRGRHQHSQYGLVFKPAEYASERIETPFEKIENTLQF